MTLAEATLTLGDYGVIGGMLLMFCGAITTLTLFTARMQARRIEVVEKRTDGQLIDVHHKFDGQVGDLAERVDTRFLRIDRDKADKHEWAREIASARAKMDNLSTQMARMESKLDANFGVAAMVGKLVDELVKHREVRTDG